MPDTIQSPAKTEAATAIEQRPAPVTDKEIESYEDLIPRRFIKLNAKGEDAAPGYQFQITAVIPQYPDSRFGAANDDDYTLHFEVVKESRTETMKVKRFAPGGDVMEATEPKIVPRIGYNKRGMAVLIDPDSGFRIAARDFVKQFKAIG